MGDSIATTSEVTALKDTIIAAESSIKLLFTELNNGQTEFVNIFRRNFIQNYIIVLNKVLIDLNRFSEDKESAKRIFIVLNSEADSIDALNQLFMDCQGKSLMTCLEEAIFDALILHDVLKNLKDSNNDTAFFISHAAQICSSVEVIKDFIELMQNEAGENNRLSRLRPGITDLLKGESCINLPEGKVSSKTMDLLNQKALQADPFSGGKAFRYLNDKFTPVELGSIRAVDEFFGYTYVRKTFEEHFREFSQQKTNLPLLVCSLPGLGKTHLTISYTLEHDNLTLILPEP